MWEDFYNNRWDKREIVSVSSRSYILSYIPVTTTFPLQSYIVSVSSRSYILSYLQDLRNDEVGFGIMTVSVSSRSYILSYTILKL